MDRVVLVRNRIWIESLVRNRYVHTYICIHMICILYVQSNVQYTRMYYVQ